MTNKIKERKLHRQCNNGIACRNVGYAIQKWMPIIPLTSPLPTSNCGMWQCVGFDLPTIHLHGSALPCAFYLISLHLFFPSSHHFFITPLPFLLALILYLYTYICMQLYRYVLYILVPCVFFSQTLISLPINKQVQHMGRSSLTGLCGRVWTSIFKDGPSSIFVQKGKGTVERYLSRDLTFALIQIFSLLAPLIIFSSLHFWYPFFFSSNLQLHFL